MSTAPAAIPGVRSLLPVLAGLLLVLLFAYNVRAFAFASDDSFISLRYARHLVEGEGLVWNPGERVEGYSNFLWVLYLAAVLKAGLDPIGMANAAGTVCGLGVLATLFALSVRRRAGQPGPAWADPFVWLAPLALAANRSFTAWCTGGLETMFYCLLVLSGYAWFARERERGKGCLSALLFAAATMTRPDGALFAFLAGLFYLGEILLGRRALRSGVLWCAAYLLPVALHVGWRWSYYGELVPNTFHAKVNGLWFDQGARYLGLFAEQYGIAWLLPLAVVPVFLGRDRFTPLLFLTASLAFLFYVLTIGGDRFEFRFLVFVMPMVFWLVGEGLAELARLGKTALSRRLALGAAGLLAFFFILRIHLATRAPELNLRKAQVATLSLIASYAETRSESGRFLRSLFDEGLLPEDLVLCVGGAGALPYYAACTTVDRRGLNDKEVARMELPERGHIAHQHDATPEYLRRRQVAIFDVFNRLVFPADYPLERLPETAEHGGAQLPIRIVRAKDRLLAFATYVPESEFQEIFRELEIVR